MFVACGTSYHAALAARQTVEEMCEVRSCLRVCVYVCCRCSVRTCIMFVACGTSYHAALAARQTVEEMCKVRACACVVCCMCFLWCTCMLLVW